MVVYVVVATVPNPDDDSTIIDVFEDEHNAKIEAERKSLKSNYTFEYVVVEKNVIKKFDY